MAALALGVKHRNYYISPDIYCFIPAGELYINSITKLQDQFVFASTYPMAGQKESLDEALKFPLSKEVMQKYMYGNAGAAAEAEREPSRTNDGFRADRGPFVSYINTF